MKNHLLFICLILLFFSLTACQSGVNQTTSSNNSRTAEVQLPPPGVITKEPEQVQELEVPDYPDEPFVGIHIDRITAMQYVNLFEAPSTLWTRYDELHWDQIEPQFTESPTYNWSPVNEEALARVGEKGYEIIGIIQFAPEWAQKYPPYACGPISELYLDRYAEFVYSLVSRYYQPPYNIHHWELGNEPDASWEAVDPHSGFGCWGDGTDPYYGGGYYAEMLKKVYPQIKSADPSASVLIGGLLLDCDPDSPPETQPGSGVLKDCSPSKFLEGVLLNGGGDYFDGVSFHSYDYYQNESGKFSNINWDTTGPVLIAKANYLRNLLDSYGYSDKSLINSELALLCGSTGQEPECNTPEYLNTKASYMAQANAEALVEGLSGNLWFSLRGWRGSGLVDKSLEKNPAFNAHIFSAEIFNHARYVNDVFSYPGVKGYEFEKPDLIFWILWSQDGVSHSVMLPTIPAGIFDVYGAPLESGQTLEVDSSPAYIFWNP
jgi:hypothetical protein